jgi:dienelactone hydrolase
MASLISGYEYDIFISYRQKDNKYDGWVTEFVDNLKKELEATFKDDVSIYFDVNPHDGLLETHNVNKSLEGKLKSLIFIPVISQTYCDPKSFAWQHEFLAFNQLASHDQFGRTVKLQKGNMAERILPVRIHDLDPEDVQVYEDAAQTVLRPVDFIYRLPGVNRQLRAKDDEQIKSPNQILYRDQINKVAHAIKDIINGLKHFQEPAAQQAQPKIAAEEPKQRKIQANRIAPDASRALRRKIAFAATPLIVLSLVAFFLIPKWLDKQAAQGELLPAIQKLVDENFRPPTSAFEMAMEAQKSIPNDSTLIRLLPIVTSTVSITTEPEGAEVFWKDYDKPESEWRSAGVTPLKEARFPRSYLRIEIRKEGYQTIQYAGPWAYARLGADIDTLILSKEGSLPEGMLRVPKNVTLMNIVGLEQLGENVVNEFLIDRYEVTNKQYKAFVEAGGYSNKAFWRFPVYSSGKEISLEAAWKLFVDRTGRQGPASWEAGTYPDGHENHPVTGVSWYEAAAYAAFVNKKLPTIFHWGIVAATSRTEFIVPFSNYNGKSTVEVGSLPGYSTFGVYDLAGNAREWCFNESSVSAQRFILGGGFNDPTYSFNDGYTQPALDRSLSNGFRCMKELPGDTSTNRLASLVKMEFRDYRKEKPVDDKTFEFIRRQYAYDKTPLEDSIEYTRDRELWTVEKVSFDAGYNKERMEAYLYIPKNAKPPFQPIIFFPGSGDIYSRKFDIDNGIFRVDFTVKSGRVLVYPIYKGTHERHSDLNSDLQDETILYKDHVTMWRKDIGRTIDYLETRKDMQVDKLAYLGWSWGGFMGGIMPALEKRIKVVVLNVGGMEMNKALPESDQLNFLPRVTQPVLMLNGKHDMFFPVETSQKPMFDLLGTPKKDKKIILYEVGHLVPRTEFVKEALLWLDHYLGPVK